MVRGNRGRSRCGSRNRSGRLCSGLIGDLWNRGGRRHLAGVFCLAFFLFDKVVTAGELFYGCTGEVRMGPQWGKLKGKDDTHTEGNTASVGFGFFYLYDLKGIFRLGGIVSGVAFDTGGQARRDEPLKWGGRARDGEWLIITFYLFETPPDRRVFVGRKQTLMRARRFV